MFPRWAPGLNTIAEADDHYCLAEAIVVIRRREIRLSTNRERNPPEEMAPNSRSPTELPGANRSWVAIGDDPEALQQRGWDDVKAECVDLKVAPIFKLIFNDESWTTHIFADRHSALAVRVVGARPERP